MRVVPQFHVHCSFPVTLGLGGGLGGGAVLVSTKKTMISSIVGLLAGGSSGSWQF
jgi:hypothetical protein